MGFYCNDCHKVFEVAKEKTICDYHGEVDTRNYERKVIDVCAYCGSDDLDRCGYCEACNEPVPPGEDICGDCASQIRDHIQAFSDKNFCGWVKAVQAFDKFIEQSNF